MNSGASEEPVARAHAPTKIVGPDFLGLRVRDLERAASFYEQELGMERMPSIPPDMVVFRTSTIPLAVRKPLPGTNLDAGRPGLGVSISLRVDDAQVLHDRLRNHGLPILIDPFDTAFGPTCLFQDPDRYAFAIHRAT